MRSPSLTLPLLLFAAATFVYLIFSFIDGLQPHNLDPVVVQAAASADSENPDHVLMQQALSHFRKESKNSVSFKPKICVVSFWESKNAIPASIDVLLDSVIRTPDVLLTLFTDSAVKPPKSRTNAQVFELTQMHASYAYRGFPGFIADRLCESLDPSPDCRAQLENTFGRYASEDSLMENLRPLFPLILKEWVNVDRCSSWVVVHPNTVISDLSKWLNNALVQSADIVTFQGGDWKQIYLRPEFTLFNMRHHPQLIIDLWKSCSQLSTVTRIVETFSRSESSAYLFETCYSEAALKHPELSILVLPFLLPSWVKPKLALLYRQRLMYCTGDIIAEKCRLCLNAETAKLAEMETQSPGSTFWVNSVLSSNAFTETKTQLNDCEASNLHRLCLDSTHTQSSEINSTFVAQVIEPFSSGKLVRLLKFHVPELKGRLNIGYSATEVREIPILGLSHWTSVPSMTPQRIKVRSMFDSYRWFWGNDRSITVERIPFYAPATGGLLISQNKILFHSFQSALSDRY